MCQNYCSVGSESSVFISSQTYERPPFIDINVLVDLYLLKNHSIYKPICKLDPGMDLISQICIPTASTGPEVGMGVVRFQARTGTGPVVQVQKPGNPGPDQRSLSLDPINPA